MTDGVNAPTRQLLEWVVRAPRTYAEAMDAWRSSCPRFSVWEDALDAELIEVEPCNGSGATAARVRLTAIGHSVLGCQLREAQH
jgi:hypothetical protein